MSSTQPASCSSTTTTTTRMNHSKRTRGDSMELTPSSRKSPTRSHGTPFATSVEPTTMLHPFDAPSGPSQSTTGQPLPHPSLLFALHDHEANKSYTSSPASSSSSTSSSHAPSYQQQLASGSCSTAGTSAPQLSPRSTHAIAPQPLHSLHYPQQHFEQSPLGSPPLIPSPGPSSSTTLSPSILHPSAPLPSVLHQAPPPHHLHQQHQQHALSPPLPHLATLPSPSALSMTSSMNYTPALSSGTMSTSSSQDGFPGSSTASHSGHSPQIAYPTTPQMMSGLGMPGAYFHGLAGIGQPMLKQISSGSNRIFINPSGTGRPQSAHSGSPRSQMSVNTSPNSNASPASQWGPMPGALPSDRAIKTPSSTRNRVVPLPAGEPVANEPSRKGEEIGLDLGEFDMLDTLGTGTFGRVILAQLRPAACRPAQTQPHYFAMKVLEKVTVVRLRQIEHLNSERATLAQVSHPFIVNLFCTFQDEQNLYLLLEYVQGGELFSHLRRAGRFSADVARFYAANLILALEYLHKKDIIYRDLKPENLLIDSMGYLKITDFGFAKHVPDRTYTLCGTPEYLAPEIIMATGHGSAADWWALGVLIFELLAGYPPFFADNPLETYERILQNKFSFPAHVDRNARDLIRHLLTPDLSKRLGNLVDGANDVKRHPWFEGVDWDAVERKQIRAPIIPHASSPSDTSNFERYPPSSIETLPAVMRAAQARKYGTLPELLPRGDDPYGYLFLAF